MKNINIWCLITIIIIIFMILYRPNNFIENFKNIGIMDLINKIKKEQEEQLYYIKSQKEQDKVLSEVEGNLLKVYKKMK